MRQVIRRYCLFCLVFTYAPDSRLRNFANQATAPFLISPGLLQPQISEQMVQSLPRQTIIMFDAVETLLSVPVPFRRDRAPASAAFCPLLAVIIAISNL